MILQKSGAFTQEKGANVNPLPPDRPTDVLRQEHQVILRVLVVLKRLIDRGRHGEDMEAESLGQCVNFFRLFADACHHAKEEDHLFPALESCGIPRDGGPIGVMLYEHKVARELTRQMGDALAESASGDESANARFCMIAEQYIDLLSRHIHKEDNILFAMGDQVMSDAKQQNLCARFGEVGCRSFDGMKREQLARIADELEAKWCDGH